MSQPRTIQIFLADGNPSGVRLAEITSRTVQVMLVPRAQLDSALRRPELSAVGVYFLVGDSPDGATPLVYVGEAEDVGSRLRQHQKQKEFWNVALVCVSKTQYFTKAHVKYLEWYCHSTMGKLGRVELENSSVPTKPFVSESTEADLADNFDTMRVLLGTLGYPFFDAITKGIAKSALVCKGKGALARGEYSAEGFSIFAGSTASPDEVPSAGADVVGLRNKLREAKVLVPQGKLLVFAKAYLFSSPSAAAATVLGRRANGWKEWRFPDGRDLDEVVRQA